MDKAIVRTFERVAGQARFLTAFFAGGVLSFILSIPFYRRDIVMVGSSAALFSVASADMLITPMTFSIMFLAPVGAVAIPTFYIISHRSTLGSPAA
ncbi:MAG: rhomboid family intramembrane serine protease [Candidatus Brockarchaeota archaeon]|nr:rhomboid family intramembrane serine protease [Candidatus Brockarchaeota archaeon]MBS7625977.1 rhomboid family intramembrane serine protease [Candidatus Bathyarchaeota archaeon]MBS7633106.1 rhomboid family intramembrane serine protease [Candidatus Bathyarchaeota archaeon]